ncbi:MAG: 1,4-alpha-glucan branching protein GlgB [Clostridiaceae bacterium]|jgi:1,4-alpha-glucan branching enzyme|nr:1,4-alpha-glucan branching protein GlgB [Clostridiaceae bacterium]
MDGRSYDFLGAHFTNIDGIDGALFAVWAPNAGDVYVIGDFNGWKGINSPMTKADDSGIWSIFIPGVKEWDMYKYEIHTRSGEVFAKADPYAFYSELRPNTASKLVSLRNFKWNDGNWMEYRKRLNIYESPVNIYELHAGSWKQRPDGRYYSYRELAEELIGYIKHMDYTHIEIMPLSEYPFDGSWGYQSTGYYSVTSRYGSPYDFMYFVDRCHQEGIGVILDWVPGHFCKDDHGLRLFDGTALYEYGDPKRSENYGWGTCNFDLGKPEVQSFLISNAVFWFDMYHVDGLRVDAVASMLYLDYDRKPGEWVPNKLGGRENLEAVDFIRKLNKAVFQYFSNVLMIAEESTAWPLVTAPVHLGGLGFNYKWNMGWMNDMLKYMKTDPINRKYHHDLLTFSLVYAFTENYILPLSHDEVVHGKKSLLDKMPGDYWQKFANLRVFLGYMATHPGKKLLFMGGEFGQFIEWRYDHALDWMLLDYEMHRRLQNYVRALNHTYTKEPALWELDHEFEGFEWIDADNCKQSIIVFMRKGKKPEDTVIIICNFTPVVYEGYKIGVPYNCSYFEIFNSDRLEYGGSDCSNTAAFRAVKQKWHDRQYFIQIKVPPLAAVYLKPMDFAGEAVKEAEAHRSLIAGN